MLQSMSRAHKQAKLMAIICISAFVVLNAVFYFLLSDMYFESHRQVLPGKGSVSTFSPAEMTAVRIAFAEFSGVIAITAFCAGVWTRVTAHLLTTLLGVLTLVACYSSFTHDVTNVLGVTLLL